MPVILHDLVELTGVPPSNSTFAGGSEIIGVVDNVGYNQDGTHGLDLKASSFTPIFTIGGVSYQLDSVARLGDFTITHNNGASTTNFDTAFIGGGLDADHSRIFTVSESGNPGNVRHFFIAPDQAGNFVDITQISFTTVTDGVTTGQEVGTLNFNSDGTTSVVVCFAAGTSILTPNGSTLVQDLKAGDLVATADHGDVPVRWIGKFTAPAATEQDNLSPVTIRKGALGNGLPWRDIRVSQQHRIMVRSKIAERIIGEKEALVAAKHLVGCEGIEIDKVRPTFSYYHFACDRHEIVFAEGAPVETLFGGEQTLNLLSQASRDELCALFPALDRPLPAQPPPSILASPARIFVAGGMARKLAMRSAKNRQPLLQTVTSEASNGRSVPSEMVGGAHRLFAQH